MPKQLSKRGFEYGPKILFFSGGSAIQELASAISAYTTNSSHIITTFDSGGSSAVLRQSFNIPAVGDIRQRIAALSDVSTPGRMKAINIWEYRLGRGVRQDSFSLCPQEYRFSAFNFVDKKSAPIINNSAAKSLNYSNSHASGTCSLDMLSMDMLHDEFLSLCSGTHYLLHGVDKDVYVQLRNYLVAFLERTGRYFDWRGACIGNLALAGAYFKLGSLEAAVDAFTKIFRISGSIFPVSENTAHLAVEFSSGRVLIGQHLFSGKSLGGKKACMFAKEGGIRKLWFASSLDNAEPMQVEMSKIAREQIKDANLICYPPGSFFSSLLANLITVGAGQEIAKNPCPKIFLPSPGRDPELYGHSFKEQLELLLNTLGDGNKNISPPDILNLVVVDRENGLYPGGVPDKWLAGLGISVLDVNVASPICKPALQHTFGAMLRDGGPVFSKNTMRRLENMGRVVDYSVNADASGSREMSETLRNSASYSDGRVCSGYVSSDENTGSQAKQTYATVKIDAVKTAALLMSLAPRK